MTYQIHANQWPSMANENMRSPKRAAVYSIYRLILRAIRNRRSKRPVFNKDTRNPWNKGTFFCMRDLLTRCSESNGCVLRSTDTDPKLPLLKTSAGQKSLLCRGARFWNSLRWEAKVAPSLSAFRRLSKDNCNALICFFNVSVLKIALIAYTENFYVYKYYEMKMKGK